MVNKNTKGSPYTNWIGAIMLLFSLVMYAIQFFVELEKEMDNTILYTIGGAGLLVWLGMSDKVVKRWFGNSK